MQAYPITIKIYAENEQEAEAARHALGGFVDALGKMGIPVTGDKIAEVAARWDKNPLIKSRIISHFKK